MVSCMEIHDHTHFFRVYLNHTTDRHTESAWCLARAQLPTAMQPTQDAFFISGLFN